MSDSAAVGTTTAAIDVTPAVSHLLHRRKWKDFDVDPEVFEKFQKGRVKFERWGRYLNLTDEKHLEIYNYAKKNPSALIVLRNSQSGALRSIRRRACNE